MQRQIPGNLGRRALITDTDFWCEIEVISIADTNFSCSTNEFCTKDTVRGVLSGVLPGAPSPQTPRKLLLVDFGKIGYGCQAF